MASLNIGGQKVTIDDSFLSMSPDQQSATVEEIASSLPKAAAPQQPPQIPFVGRMSQHVMGALNAAMGGAMLPGQVMQEQPKSEISDSDVSAMSVPSVLGLSTFGTGVNPMVRSGDRAIPGVASNLYKEKVPTPSSTQLYQAGDADIKNAVRSDLRVSPSAVAEKSQQVQQNLFDSPIHPVDAKKTFTKLKDLEDVPVTDPSSAAYFTPANLQALRKSLQLTARNFNPDNAADQLAASRAIRQWDEFLPNIAPKDVVAGPTSSLPATQTDLVMQALAGKREAGRVADLFQRGRGNEAAAFRSNALTGELEDKAVTGLVPQAEMRARGGGDFDRQVRSRLATLLSRKKEITGYNDAEVAALKGVQGGGMLRDATGLMSAIPVVGRFSGKIADALARRDVAKVDELIRQRSPLYQEALQQAEMLAPGTAKRAAIAKALLLGAMSGQQ